MSQARVRLAVLGDPLRYTLSPALHRAGLEAVGMGGESVALRVSPGDLAATLDRLERTGLRGVNLTHPHKEAALALVARASATARRARSVNTIGFGPAERWGESTDGSGFLDFMASVGCQTAGLDVVLLGAGGAARSLALALLEAGVGGVCVSAREPGRAAGLVALDPARVRAVAWRSAEERSALADADVVVNCTPLGSNPADEAPLPPGHAGDGAALIDLVYGEAPTRWVQDARQEGRTAWDGLGTLVFQARRSLELWLERPIPLEPLMTAVGWPR